MSAHPIPEGYRPNDLGVTWEIAAAEIVAEWRRRTTHDRVRLADPRTSPQLLARWGLTRAALRTRTRLLRAARRGAQEARTALMRRFGVRVWQAADLPGRKEMTG